MKVKWKREVPNEMQAEDPQGLLRFRVECFLVADALRFGVLAPVLGVGLLVGLLGFKA